MTNTIKVRAIRNRNGSLMYYITSDGSHIYNALTGREVKQWVNPKSKRMYATILLNNKEWRAPVYRLVAMAYLNDGYSYPIDIEIHHRDFNRNNNYYKNLVPLTAEEHDRLHAERRRAK